jgi:RNA polymerase sigma-70 factor (ECF subfamily)
MGRPDIGSSNRPAGGTLPTRRPGQPAVRAPSEPPDPARVESDVQLMERIGSGDAAALSVFYDRHARVVFSFAQRILRDREAAEELLQEVFFRVWRRADAYRPNRGEPVSWLLTMTHNMAIDELRKRQRRPQKVVGDIPELPVAGTEDGRLGIEEEAWRRVLRETLASALTTLPPAQREAVALTYFEGLTQREVAEAVGAPLGTIKTRLRLGLDKLRIALELDGVAEAA